jgi:predicted nucleic acid-binding protein
MSQIAVKIGTMTMGVRIFLDTNVLLRMLHAKLPLHNECLARVESFIEADYELWISRQVIREYLVNVTHPRTFDIPLTLDECMTQIDTIYSLFKLADEDEVVTHHLLNLLHTIPTRGKQIHDANIIATMLAYDIQSLLTLNIDDMKRFTNHIHVMSPLDNHQEG